MTEVARPGYVPDGEILFGAAYYPEYFPKERMLRDLSLMSEAHVTVIRVGESVWSTWEPRDGEFEIEWLRPVLDEAHRLGIRVVLGTPTYAIPPWMQKAHPEFAGETATGVRVPWGGRQEIDFTNPDFLRYCERVIRVMLKAYADHPAVIGFQVDNEPGLHLLHNAEVFRRFVDELRERYGDVERLNEEWGLVYWSHRLSDFDELWTPDGNTLPQYDLAWRRFQTGLTSEFIAWQADLVRGYASPEQFVTTCLALSRAALDEMAVTDALDVTSVNLYYGMQDHLELETDIPAIAEWVTTGVWGLFHSADRAFAASQDRYLVSETNAGKIGMSDQNYPPYPGQLAQAALAIVSRGSAMIEYWHWNTIPYGTETFWGGVLPHSGEPGRVYREVQELGRVLSAIGPQTRGFRPDHDITVLLSTSSKWAFDFSPPVPDVPAPEHVGAYGLIVSAFYRGIIESGAQGALLHERQLVRFSADELVVEHPVLMIPALAVADDDTVRRLREYAEAGGHLVLGPRSVYFDDEARARTSRAPFGLSDAAGVWYEESSNLTAPLEVRSRGGIHVNEGARATLWAEGLVVEDAEVLLDYVHEEHGRYPAVTSRAFGRGRVSYIGTVPDRALAADIARWLVPTPIGGDWIVPPSVTVASGVNDSGSRVWFVHNWSGRPVELTVPTELVDAVDGGVITAETPLRLEAWGVRVLC